MRPYAVGIGLGVWGCADLETMSGSGDHQIMRSGGLEMLAMYLRTCADRYADRYRH